MSIKVEGFFKHGHDYSIGQYIFGKSGILYQAKQPPASTADMIYDNNGNTEDSAGIINVGMMDNKSIQVVGNRASGTAILVQVEGKACAQMPWSVNLPVNYDDSGSFTDWIVITERMAFMRIGIQMVGGSPGANDWITLAINIGR